MSLLLRVSKVGGDQCLRSKKNSPQIQVFSPQFNPGEENAPWIRCPSLKYSSSCVFIVIHNIRADLRPAPFQRKRKRKRKEPLASRWSPEWKCFLMRGIRFDCTLALTHNRSFLEPRVVPQRSRSRGKGIYQASVFMPFTCKYVLFAGHIICCPSWLWALPSLAHFCPPV